MQQFARRGEEGATEGAHRGEEGVESERGCANMFFVKIECMYFTFMYIYTKRAAPFLHGEEGATLCSGEGLRR